MNTLSVQEVKQISATETKAYVGFYDGLMSNIIPVNFFWKDGSALYAYTRFRKKARTLKKSPELCVEIDLSVPSRWCSVTLWGNYEDLKDKTEREWVYRKFLKMTDPRQKVAAKEIPEDTPKISGSINRDSGHIFLIRIQYITGMEEKTRDDQYVNTIPQPLLEKMMRDSQT